MRLLIKHTTYSIIACLRSLKFTYTNSLNKKQFYFTKEDYDSEILTLINITLKSHHRLSKKFKIQDLLRKYTSNKQITEESSIDKYLQSYIYLSKKQTNFHYDLSTDKYAKKISPLSLTGLNSLYFTYKLVQSNHPVYIYYEVNNKS